MALTRSQVAELYTPIYDEFLLEDFAQDSLVHPMLFQEISDSTKTYKYDGLSGLGEWEDADESSGGGYEDPVLSYPKTFTQTKKWKKFQVSFESVDQDEYALLKKQDDARQLGRGGRVKAEKDTSAVLNNGFDTAGPDGQNLWSNSHPKNPQETGVTYDNLLSGPFSHDNLEAAEKQISDNYKDSKGLPIECAYNPCLVYGPSLRGQAARVLEQRANLRPGTDHNDINRFAGRYTPVEWRYLSADLGGSDTAWFIIFKEVNFLKIIWSQRPHFTSWIDEDNEQYKFKGRMLYATGVCSWRAGFASTGL